jgi:SAM-dependent methyltransferase
MLSKRFVNDEIAAIFLNEIQKNAKRLLEQKIRDNIYTFEDVFCPVCETDDYKLLAQKDRYGLAVNTVICKKCGLLITTPRMTLSSLSNFYADDYRELYTGSKFAQFDFADEQYKHGLNIAKFIKTRSNILSFQDMLVIEVGCGAGGILAAFKQQGACVIGLDLGNDYLEYGRQKYNLNLQQKSVKDYKGEKPDILIYSHVLEHTILPDEIVNMKNICHDKTLIYVEVPGLLSIHKQYGDFLLYLQNAHLYHFSLNTLTNLFQKFGFSLVYGNEDIKCLLKTKINNKELLNLFDKNFSYLQFIERHKILCKIYKNIGRFKYLLKCKIKKLIKR